MRAVSTPAVVLGAGMGKMNVLSGLGQPLLAEIDLVSVQEDELSGMVARLASPEMFPKRSCNIHHICQTA